MSAVATQPEQGLASYPNERRIQVLAIGTLLAAALVDAVLVGLDPVRLVGVTLAGFVVQVVIVVGVLVGVVAVLRRDLRVLAVAVAALALPALAERAWEVTPFRFFGSVLFGFLLLAYGELVHMTTRYEKWHKATDARGGAGEQQLDHATDEYLHTFTAVFGVSALVALLVGAVFAMVLWVGPAQQRASLDFRSFYGLVAASLVVFGAMVLYSLARGADWTLLRRRAAESPPPDPQDKVVVDGIE